MDEKPGGFKNEEFKKVLQEEMKQQKEQNEKPILTITQKIRRGLFILLWLTIPSVIETILLFNGVLLGAIPTVILFAPFIYLVRNTLKGEYDNCFVLRSKLTKQGRYTEHAQELPISDSPEPPVPQAVQDEDSIPDSPSSLSGHNQTEKRKPVKVILHKRGSDRPDKPAQMEPPPLRRSFKIPFIVTLSMLIVSLTAVGILAYQTMLINQQREAVLAENNNLQDDLAYVKILFENLKEKYSKLWDIALGDEEMSFLEYMSLKPRNDE